MKKEKTKINTWQNIAYHAKHNEWDDQTLKEIILLMYYNNYKGCSDPITVHKDEMRRKLFIDFIQGDYTTKGIWFSVQGSPAKGGIVIPNIGFKLDVFLHAHNGKFKGLLAPRYRCVRQLFLIRAEQIVTNFNKSLKDGKKIAILTQSENKGFIQALVNPAEVAERLRLRSGL